LESGPFAVFAKRASSTQLLARTQSCSRFHDRLRGEVIFDGGLQRCAGEKTRHNRMQNPLKESHWRRLTSTLAVKSERDGDGMMRLTSTAGRSPR
jgi:hypothetical protein